MHGAPTALLRIFQYQDNVNITKRPNDWQETVQLMALLLDTFRIRPYDHCSEITSSHFRSLSMEEKKDLHLWLKGSVDSTDITVTMALHKLWYYPRLLYLLALVANSPAWRSLKQREWMTHMMTPLADVGFFSLMSN